MQEHRLRREIIATHITNSMVNRCGTTFAFRLQEETGGPPPEISRAYMAAREIFGMRDLWAQIEALDTRVEAQTQIRMLLDARKLVERATRWLLRNRRPPLDVAATVSYFAGRTAELSERIPELLPHGDREVLEKVADQLVEANVPPELARRMAILNKIFSALDIVDIAEATNQPAQTAAEVYFALGDRLRIHWLRNHVEALPRENRWQTLARAALRDDLYSQQAELTAEILRSTVDDLPPAERIEAWVNANWEPVERTLQVLTDINASGAFGLATLSVALREIRNLITSSSTPPQEVEAPTG
jgi:glutamate dehydrogenase